MRDTKLKLSLKDDGQRFHVGLEVAFERRGSRN